MFSFFFLLGGLFLATELMALASLGFMVAVFTGMAALIRIAIAWYINHASYVNTARQFANAARQLAQLEPPQN